MEYKRITLDYKSLEPYIDDRTLDLHYNAHYRIKDNLKNLYVVNSFEEALDILTFNLEVKL